MSTKRTINLLQPELIPEKPLLTIKRMLMVWGVVFALMIAISVLTNMQDQRLLAEVAALTEVNQQHANRIAQLESQLANHKPDAKLTSKLEKSKVIFQNKSNIYNQLTNTTDSYISGFSFAMKELADLHSKNVSLNKIYIDADKMIFAGFARKAESVPSWLANFERSEVLSGKTFGHFSLAETEGNYLMFSVQTSSAEQEGQK